MIPAYNEEKTIGEVVKRTAKLYPNFDILVINDGSEDETEAKAEKTGVNVLTLPFHTGGTAAVLTGYLVALRQGYNYLVKIDGDGQHKPEDVIRVLQPLAANEADMCVGSRYLTKKNDAMDDSIVKLSGDTSTTLPLKTSTQFIASDLVLGSATFIFTRANSLATIFSFSK